MDGRRRLVVALLPASLLFLGGLFLQPLWRRVDAERLAMSGYAGYAALRMERWKGVPAPPLLPLPVATALSSAALGALYALWGCALRAEPAETPSPLADPAATPYPARSDEEEQHG